MRNGKYLKQQFFIRWTSLLLLSFFLRTPVSAQDIPVAGTVTVEKTNEPLTGASVKIKGTVTSVLTDENGRFSLKVSPAGILVISHVGYETLEMAVNNRRTINISLVSTSAALDEVLVVGYGTQKKVNLTGAVDVISNKKRTGNLPQYRKFCRDNLRDWIFR